MAKIEWQEGPPPSSPEWEGRCCLIQLKQPSEDVPFEHYGDPIVVRIYGYKLKTTVDPIRIEYDHVARWAELDWK